MKKIGINMTKATNERTIIGYNYRLIQKVITIGARKAPD
jgi:hypothetical protein